MSHLYNRNVKIFKEHCRYCTMKNGGDGVDLRQEPSPKITGVRGSGRSEMFHLQIAAVSKYSKSIAGITTYNEKKRGRHSGVRVCIGRTEPTKKGPDGRRSTNMSHSQNCIVKMFKDHCR